MKKALLSVALAAASLAASAASIPVFQTFGALPTATFGGTGIPNSAVAMTTVGSTTIGLTAHGRYANPTPGNDGAGRFFAASGVDQTDATSIAGLYAKWNFGFDIQGSDIANYDFYAFLDVDPTGGENFKGGLITGAKQDSTNLGFNGLEAFFGYTFNPNASGEYAFKVVTTQKGVATNVLGTTQIVVEVPEPASLALVGAALLAAGAVRRRKSV